MRDEEQEGPEDRPAWAWIDLEALRRNARRAIECAAGRAVIGVVKADGYGHGAEAIAKGLLAAGVSRLAVVSVGEGASLRRAGIVAPILLMGELGDSESIERALKWNLTPVLHGLEDFRRVRSLGRQSAPLAVEIDIDTGMHRMGVSPASAAIQLVREVAATPGLALSGLYTHLACADDEDPASAQDQVTRFGRILAELGQARGEASIHVVNSAGLLRREEIETPEAKVLTQAVRPGLMLYGVSPFVDRSAESLGLRPVMSLAARVVSVRDVPGGEGVGYGAQWRAPVAGARIATLPLGYADGLPRALADSHTRSAEVMIGERRFPLVGRVSMDYVTVDISRARDEVGVGSVATFFGATEKGARVPVEGLAAAAGTIGYEMLTSVGPRVPRILGEGPPPMGDPGGFDRAV